VSEVWQKRALELAKAATQALDEISKVSPQTTIGVSSSPAESASKIVTALEQFQECVRYLNTRRSKGAIIDINGEDDLQDVIFLMLRPWICDLTPENPTDRVASRFVIKDFLSKELNTVIEAKFIRDKTHGRQISKELHDDIETYRTHPNCSELVFFIYDPDAFIPDVSSLRRQIEGIRNYEGKKMGVYCIVKP